MIRTTVYLPENLHTRLRERALAEKTSMAKIIISFLGSLGNSYSNPSRPRIIKTPEDIPKPTGNE